MREPTYNQIMYEKNKAKYKEYYMKNREHILQRQREYQARNKVKYDKYQTEYYKRRRRLEYYKNYRNKNRSKIREYHKKYYQKQKQLNEPIPTQKRIKSCEVDKIIITFD